MGTVSVFCRLSEILHCHGLSKMIQSSDISSLSNLEFVSSDPGDLLMSICLKHFLIFIFLFPHEYTKNELFMRKKNHHLTFYCQIKFLLLLFCYHTYEYERSLNFYLAFVLFININHCGFLLSEKSACIIIWMYGTVSVLIVNKTLPLKR